MRGETILAFDYGSKRVGVAKVDVEFDQPTALTVLDNGDRLFDSIGEMITKHHPSLFVVGLPRNLDGEDSAQTKLSREFAEEIKAKFSIPVELQDEAMSSERALKRLGDSTSPKDRKQEIDKMAAQIILEDYINARKS